MVFPSAEKFVNVFYLNENYVNWKSTQSYSNVRHGSYIWWMQMKREKKVLCVILLSGYLMNTLSNINISVHTMVISGEIVDLE